MTADRFHTSRSVADAAAHVPLPRPGKRRQVAATGVCRPSLSGTSAAGSRQGSRSPGLAPTSPARVRQTTTATEEGRLPAPRWVGMEMISADKAQDDDDVDDADVAMAMTATMMKQMRWSNTHSRM